MWNLDGLVVTDMTATGGSPTYFDFDAFQEINVTTGGADLQVQAGGIGINLVTKRGTNKFHGGGRLPHPRRPAVEQPPRRARGRPAAREPRRHLPRQGRPHPADRATTASTSAARSSRTSSGSTGAGASRTSGSCASTAPRTRPSSPPTTPSSTGRPRANTMVSAFFFDGQEGEVRPQPRAPGSTSRPTSCGTRQRLRGRAGPTACGSSRWTRPSRPTSSCRRRRPTTTPASASSPPATRSRATPTTTCRARRSAAYYDYFPVRPQKALNVDGSYFVAGPRAATTS